MPLMTQQKHDFVNGGLFAFRGHDNSCIWAGHYQSQNYRDDSTANNDAGKREFLG